MTSRPSINMAFHHHKFLPPAKYTWSPCCISAISGNVILRIRMRRRSIIHSRGCLQDVDPKHILLVWARILIWVRTGSDIIVRPPCFPIIKDWDNINHTNTEACIHPFPKSLSSLEERQTCADLDTHWTVPYLLVCTTCSIWSKMPLKFC